MSSSLKVRRGGGRASMALFIATSAVALCACSAQDESDVAIGEESADFTREASLDPDEREAEFQRQHTEQLSPEEMSAVESRLRELGVDVTEVALSGRMLVFGDAYLSADVVLGGHDAAGTVEKGNTLAVKDTNRSIDNAQIAPDIYSQRVNNQYQFHRPDIDSVTIVVPSSAGAAFLVGMFREAAAAIWGAANDCLLGGASVLTETQWNALSFNVRRFSKPIFVRYGSLGNVCPPGGDPTTRACSLYPRLETRDFGDASAVTRLVPGTRIGVVSSAISSNTPRNVGTLMHELLHTLGVAHPFDPNGIKVIQTSSSNSVTSVMQACEPGAVGCNISFTLSVDDVDVIDTLYSPQPGGSCAYSFGMRTLVGN